VPEIMNGRAHEVFLHQLSWNVAKWPILCRCDLKPNQSNKLTNKQTNKHFLSSMHWHNPHCIETCPFYWNLSFFIGTLKWQSELATIASYRTLKVTGWKVQPDWSSNLSCIEYHSTALPIEI
jgi:hypothetical protein